VTRDLATFDLAGAMRGLYETDAYYVSLPPGEISYEENYWGNVVDPDGVSRDRTTEREAHLTNLAHEIDFIASLPTGRVLDVGCGLGWLLSALDNDWRKHGVEISSFAAEHAGNHAEIFNGPLLDYPLPTEPFDLVVMHHVIEHMVDPATNIRRVFELLKPGGRLVIGTPDFDSGCARRFGSNYRLLHDPTHVSLFSSDSMHRMLRDNGFNVLQVDYPFFETSYFSKENLSRLFDVESVSPPFYGNFMTFYCQKP
jgi:SAM-dependent methyltransferase